MFLSRLAALIPTPRVSLVTYHGLLAPATGVGCQQCGPRGIGATMMRSLIVSCTIAASSLPAQSDWDEFYPCRRVEYAMQFYDGHGAVLDHILMFGGLSEATSVGVPLGDTWLWSKQKWIRHEQVNGPERRSASAISAGPNKTLVMFGGQNGGSILGDTWVWEGTKWTLQIPVQSPPPRDLHSMAYDESRGVVVMFGGSDASGNSLDDTWEWDGVAWKQRQVNNRREPRFSAPAAWDPGQEKVMVFGGIGHTGIPIPGATPGYRLQSLDAYGPKVRATSTSVGKSCLSGGTLRLTPGQRPYLGTTATLTWNLSDSTYVPYLYLGMSLAVPPIDLDIIGLPGCLLYLSPDALTLLPAGAKEFDLLIPDDPALIGAKAWAQLLEFNQPARLFTGVTSAIEMALQMR